MANKWSDPLQTIRTGKHLILIPITKTFKEGKKLHYELIVSITQYQINIYSGSTILKHHCITINVCGQSLRFNKQDIENISMKHNEF